MFKTSTPSQYVCRVRRETVQPVIGSDQVTPSRLDHML